MQKIIDRFVKYIKIDTQSDAENPAFPSTEKQWDLAKILVEDLKELGPIRTDWPYYSKLGKEKYHCHLGHSWVACWIHKKNTVIIEVYYAGSRENAQY